MNRFLSAALTVALTAMLAVPALARQQPDPDSPRYKGVMALEEFIGSEGDEAVAAFIDTRIAASVLESMGREALAETLAAIRVEADGAEMRGARPVGPLAAALVFDLADGAEMNVEFELDEQDNDRFVAIRTPGHSIG